MRSIGPSLAWPMGPGSKQKLDPNTSLSHRLGGALRGWTNRTSQWRSWALRAQRIPVGSRAHTVFTSSLSPEHLARWRGTRPCPGWDLGRVPIWRSYFRTGRLFTNVPHKLDAPPLAGWFSRAAVRSLECSADLRYGPRVNVRSVQPGLSDERGRGELPRCPVRARGCSLDLFVVLGRSYVV